MKKQLSLFNKEDHYVPDEYISSTNWDARITVINGKRKVQLRSGDNEIKTYHWSDPTIEQVKMLLDEAERLQDFPDIVASGGQRDTTSSAAPPRSGESNHTTSSETNLLDAREKNHQSGWIQKSYRIRVDGKQMSLSHWQKGATGPYYCYRYKAGKRTPGVYFRRDRYTEILAAINAGRSVQQILKILY